MTKTFFLQLETKAILCITGCLLINLTLGTFYTIGNTIDYVVSYMRNNGQKNVSPEYGTWLTATYLFGQGFFMLIGAKVEKTFNARVSLCIGCLIHSLSNFATAWAVNTSFFILVLVNGFGTGAGCGAAYIAAILSAQGWLPKNKGIATGLMVSGFGLGGLIFSPLQTLYINPENKVPSEMEHVYGDDIIARVPYMYLYMGAIITTMQIIGILLAYPPPVSSSEIISSQPTRDKESSNSTTANQTNTQGVIIEDNELLPQVTSMLGIFKFKLTYVIGLMMMLVAPGVTFVSALGKTYGSYYLKDDKYLTIVFAVCSVANAAGRLTWGYLIEKFGFRICFTAKICLFAFLIVLFPYSFIISSKILYTIWMLGLFFGFSGTFVLFPVYIEQLYGRKTSGMVYGTLYIFLALSSAITSLVIQTSIGPKTIKYKDPNDTMMIRVATCSTIAGLYLLSLGLYYVTLPTRRLENAVTRRADIELARTRNSLANRQDLMFPANKQNLGSIKSNDTGTTLGSGKEPSLGSIVRFKDAPKLPNT